MKYSAKAVLAAIVCAGISATSALAQDPTQLAITTTSQLLTQNPYGDSNREAYNVWCQVYGCLGRLDSEGKELKPLLAEKWEAIEPTRWRFTLRTDLKAHDGGPGPTSADVIHSWQQIMNGDANIQRFLFQDVKEIVAVSDSEFDIVTETPDSGMPATLFGYFAITSKAAYDEYGEDVYTRDANGWGPYTLDEYDIDQRIVLEKADTWPETVPDAPDRVIFTRMLEPDQRVTALLNGEVQVATELPPQLIDRLNGRDDVKLVPAGSVELMFLAFNSQMEPWNDVRVRRAASYAIDKDTIIDRLLFGYADRLDGPLGKYQLCYDEPAEHAINYDPDKARALLAEAGYADGGPKVTLYSTTGRFVSDRQIGEVLKQMLEGVGFDVTLQTPELATLWSDIRSGNTPFYYFGRGQAADVYQALSQYFQTGITPRTGYSNPELDEMFEDVRETFDPAARCEGLRKLSDFIAQDVPAQFLWTHQFLNGVAANVDLPADPSGGVSWLLDVHMN